MSEPVTLDPAVYWKLKCLILEENAYQREAQQRLEAMQKYRKDAMVAAGLTPDAVYQIDDAACTMTLQDPT